MFEEPANDRYESNRGTKFRYTGAQDSEPADDQVNRHAGLGRAVKRLANVWILKLVHLADDVGRTTFFVRSLFLLDHCQEPFFHIDRCDQKPRVVMLDRSSRQ